jgi:hypothetical protein
MEEDGAAEKRRNARRFRADAKPFAWHRYPHLQDDLAGGGMQRTRGLAVPSRGIGAIMSGFKAAVSSAIANQELGVSGPVWQRGFHDRIIRDERELQQFREYIANNALQWELDGYFEQEIGGP